MSESSAKGKSLENWFAKLLRTKLGVQVQRDPRSGAGDGNKADILDWFNQTRMHFEVKNQKTVKIKEWYRQAAASASVGQVPTLIFALDERTNLACLPAEELVNLLAETKQAGGELEALRRPITPAQIHDQAQAIVAKMLAYGLPSCPNGHVVTPGLTKCLAKGCPYSSSYKAKKSKEAK